PGRSLCDTDSGDGRRTPATAKRHRGLKLGVAGSWTPDQDAAVNTRPGAEAHSRAIRAWRKGRFLSSVPCTLSRMCEHIIRGDGNLDLQLRSALRRAQHPVGLIPPAGER